MDKANKPLPICYLSLNHLVAQRFRAVPRFERPSKHKEIYQLITVVGCIGGAITSIMLFPNLQTEYAGMTIMLAGITLTIVILVNQSIHLALGDMHSCLQGDIHVLGHPLESERYVGICYLDAIIEKGEDSSLDRGWLSIYSGKLIFRGHASSFQLPLCQVESIRLVKTDRNLTLSLPRVLIQWRHPQGTLESILLEERIGHSRLEIREETKRLFDWLSGARGIAPQNQADERFLPLRSSELDKAVTYRSNAVVLEDHLFALTVTVAYILASLITIWVEETFIRNKLLESWLNHFMLLSPALYMWMLGVRQRNRKRDTEDPS